MQDKIWLGLARSPVLGRHLDRAESVDGDEDDGELGDEADGVVDREPEVAQDRPQLRRPVAHQDVSAMDDWELGSCVGGRLGPRREMERVGIARIGFAPRRPTNTNACLLKRGTFLFLLSFTYPEIGSSDP